MFGAIVGVIFGIYVVLALLNVAGLIVGAVFSGMASLIAGAFSGEGIVLGIVIGLVWYYLSRKNTVKEG